MPYEFVSGQWYVLSRLWVNVRGKRGETFFFSFLSQSFHLLSSQSRKLKTIESTWCNSGSWLSEQWSDCEGRVRLSLLGFLQTSKPGRLDLASYHNSPPTTGYFSLHDHLSLPGAEAMLSMQLSNAKPEWTAWWRPSLSRAGQSSLRSPS